MGPAAEVGGERCGDRIGLLTLDAAAHQIRRRSCARARADQRGERDLLEVLEMVLLAVEGRVVRGERIEQPGSSTSSSGPSDVAIGADRWQAELARTSRTRRPRTMACLCSRTTIPASRADQIDHEPEIGL